MYHLNLVINYVANVVVDHLTGFFGYVLHGVCCAEFDADTRQ